MLAIRSFIANYRITLGGANCFCLPSINSQVSYFELAIRINRLTWAAIAQVSGTQLATA